MPISVRTPRSLARAAAPLRALALAALAQEGRRAGEITILLTDDAELRALNLRYRGLDRATDVLSFQYPGRDGRIDGDIAISLERVAEQARRFRVGRGAELARLVVHGTLHLAGLDHRHAAERRRMRSRESRVMRGARAAMRDLGRVIARA